MYPLTCKSREILTRIIRSPYITNADSRHFNSPVERCLFEDVAGVSGNRCIKHGSSSAVVDWQTSVGAFFQDPDMSKNIFRFPVSPKINDTRSAYRTTSGTGSLNLVEIGCAVPEIFVRERKRVPSRRRGRSQEDDHSLTFDANEFGVRELTSAEIGLAVFEKSSNRQTHGQTPLLYIYIYIYIYIYMYMIVITAYSCIKAYVVFMPDLQGKGERSGSPALCTQTCPAYAEGLARETTKNGWANFFGRGYDLSWIYNMGTLERRVACVQSRCLAWEWHVWRHTRRTIHNTISARRRRRCLNY